MVWAVHARESNEASETVVPTTFVDDAELVWNLTEKFTQKELVAGLDDEAVADIATTVAKSPFSENLLRNILDLSADQQRRLCRWLVHAPIALYRRRGYFVLGG